MGSRKHGRSGYATQSRDRSGVAQDTLSVRFTASKKNPGKGDKRRGPETRVSWMGYPTALIAKRASDDRQFQCQSMNARSATDALLLAGAVAWAA